MNKLVNEYHFYSHLQTIPGEVLIDSLPEVEDTKGNNGEQGIIVNYIGPPMTHESLVLKGKAGQLQRWGNSEEIKIIKNDGIFPPS